MDPSAILALCNLQITDSVADFGAGSGFMARAAAKIVSQGSVFAIEIHRDIVARLAREASDLHIKNMNALWGDIEIKGGTKLGDNAVNFVILSNIFFSLQDKEGCMREAWRVLRPGGRALIVDWTESFGGLGPQPQAVFTKDMAIALATRCGFTVLRDDLPAGDHHYAILLQKA